MSVLGTESEKQATFDGLASVASNLRSRVARELQLRVAPEIQFKEDDTIARAARIETRARSRIFPSRAPRPTARTLFFPKNRPRKIGIGAARSRLSSEVHNPQMIDGFPG